MTSRVIFCKVLQMQCTFSSSERVGKEYYIVENAMPVCCRETHSVAMLKMISRRKAASCPHVSLCSVYLFRHFDISSAFVLLIYADTSRLRNSVCATPIVRSRA